MVNKFTMKMAELVADNMANMDEDGFILKTDGGRLGLFNRGNCIGKYKLGEVPINTSMETIKVNMNAFKNPNGKVVKYKLAKYLHNVINDLLVKQNTKARYKTLEIRNKQTRKVSKNTQRVVDNTKDSDELEL